MLTHYLNVNMLKSYLNMTYLILIIMWTIYILTNYFQLFKIKGISC